MARYHWMRFITRMQAWTPKSVSTSIGLCWQASSIITDGAFPRQVVGSRATTGKDYGTSSVFLYAPSSLTNGFMLTQDFLWSGQRTHAMMPMRLSILAQAQKWKWADAYDFPKTTVSA